MGNRRAVMQHDHPYADAPTVASGNTGSRGIPLTIGYSQMHQRNGSMATEHVARRSTTNHHNMEQRVADLEKTVAELQQVTEYLLQSTNAKLDRLLASKISGGGNNGGGMKRARANNNNSGARYGCKRQRVVARGGEEKEKTWFWPWSWYSESFHFEKHYYLYCRVD